MSFEAVHAICSRYAGLSLNGGSGGSVELSAGDGYGSKEKGLDVGDGGIFEI